MNSPNRRLTWERLVELEPGCAALVSHARQCRIHDPRLDSLNTFIDYYKSDVAALVGWRRKSNGVPELATTTAYNLFYAKVLEALGYPC